MQLNNVIPFETDPFSAPIEIPDESPTAQGIRKAHIHAEADIKAIGTFLLCVAVVAGILHLVRSLGQPDMSATGTQSILFTLAWLAGTALCGVWIRAFQPSGRMLFTLMSAISLVQFAIEAPVLLALLEAAATVPATAMVIVTFLLISILLRVLFLYTLWNRRGRMVMSRHYRDTIIPATPGVARPRSRVAIAVALGFLLMIAAIVGSVIASL